MYKHSRLYTKTENSYVDFETGEIIRQEEFEKWFVPREEPDYIKVYLNTVLTFNNLSNTLNPLILELLKYMTWADDEGGGQMICLTAVIRNRICDRLNITGNSLTRNLTQLAKSKILYKLGSNTYQVNPFIFGKGDWASVKAIRATFNFNAGTIISEILENE